MFSRLHEACGRVTGVQHGNSLGRCTATRDERLWHDLEYLKSTMARWPGCDWSNPSGVRLWQRKEAELRADARHRATPRANHTRGPDVSESRLHQGTRIHTARQQLLILVDDQVLRRQRRAQHFIKVLNSKGGPTRHALTAAHCVEASSML